MILKKIASLLLIAATIMLPNTPAYAQENVSRSGVVTPYVIGVGDARENAINLFEGQEPLTLYLENANEADWFKWTNDTGLPLLARVSVFNKGNYNTITVGAIVKYANGRETTLMLSEPTKQGNTNWPAELEFLYVPEGATIFYRVKANSFVNVEPYKLHFRVTLF